MKALASNPELAPPRSIWASVVLVSIWALKSALLVDVVAGYSPNCKSVDAVPVCCKTSTLANSPSVFSTFVVVAWKSVNSFVVLIWVLKSISFEEVWIWLKSSVAVGIASKVVGIESFAFVDEVTGYSPKALASLEVFIFKSVSILLKLYKIIINLLIYKYGWYFFI